MHIDITSKNLDLTGSLDTYIRSKLGALDKFVKRYEELGELELRVIIERSTAHHHKGEVYRASVDLVLPQANLHAEETNEDARVAVDSVRSKLHAEIEKYRSEH